MVRLAAFLPVAWMKFLMTVYNKMPDSRWFRINIIMARLFSIVLMEPITYLRVIWLSQGKHLGRTIRVLPNYLREGWFRFRKQFT